MPIPSRSLNTHTHCIQLESNIGSALFYKSIPFKQKLFLINALVLQLKNVLFTYAPFEFYSKSREVKGVPYGKAIKSEPQQ